ncbi:MAG: FAD-dependent oxidoreductase [Desulfobacterales bacterium]|uniref:FAD-dependent oxidoreductase n=1 Tax=Candidatus Desulfatibia profunda TaxID=2841695 RepID=A0A8J6NJH6_9BACT|nr:FAD-dependent oxidoreductase [Candidatus Desulfatibia profunda]MBL7179079.1 FAD-dependent oxidoreductase [Desulfobacterales bacterium]
MKFVIIGGDAAGMSAASRAKRNRPDLEVIVLEKTVDVSYSACGMPYNIADPDRDIDDLVVRPALVFREKLGIDLLTGHCVEAIDAKAKTVSGSTLENDLFTLPYDQLLIATGAASILPDLPGFDLPGVLTLKSLADGRAIKHFLASNAVQKVVIVGMGYIALEMCEALRARNIEVAMVKPGDVFLPWMEPSLADVVKAELESNGVQLYPGRNLEKIEYAAGSLNVVCTDLTLSGDMVLVAVGVRPNSELAADAGIELGEKRAIAVSSSLRTSDKNVFAAGDCADAFHVVTGQKTWIPLALRANRAGWAVADNVCGKDVKLPGIAGTAVFKVFNLEVARTGLNSREASASGFMPAEVVIQSRTRAHAHPGASTIWVQMVGDKKTGRLLGVQMVGREGAAHRINAPAVALHGRMTLEQFSQSDMAYAPPFGPVWDPMLVAANQLIKAL